MKNRPNHALRLILLATALIVAGPTVAPRDAEAQIIPRSLEIDVGGGYYWFLSNLENLHSSPIVGGSIGVNFFEFVGFEANFDYTRTYTWHGHRLGDYFTSHYDLIVHTTPWRVIPYFAVGVGFQNYSIREEFRNDTPLDDENKWRDPYAPYEGREGFGDVSYRAKDIDLIIDVGAGIKFLLHERVGLRIDFRYLPSFGDNSDSGDDIPYWDDNDNLQYEDRFHHLKLRGSVFFLLGGGPGKDTDRDGIPDREDDCAADPEDKDDFQDEDGCPDLDNDADDVLDKVDQCPNVSEDRDGWRDADGCPDLDNDGDGLQDSEDSCPNKAEDGDGFEDEDGCPDLDNDGDGIPDARDSCPGEAEDDDGFRDDDGCPEPDNDGDGVADPLDLCPNAPEEVNGIDDEDGCPERDADGDGVYDGRDQCPEEAEDLDGFEDKDGCPDVDNDVDGIPDSRDMCPMDAEDADGHEDGDGCPDRDNDEDGLLDVNDTCPDKAEDDDGFEDKDGCPDYDNDQDGVLDGEDGCPVNAEVINGFEDSDGCPDEIPEELKKFTGVIPDIKFKVNSDELLPSSYPTLDRAADVLIRYDGVRIEIQGHASSEGDDSYNLELSDRRAASVMRYLAGRGVDRSRLQSRGYGSTVPVATNRTEEGRSQNRRVEFRIVARGGLTAD